MTVNEKLLDASIAHQIDLTYYSNNVVNRIIAILKKSDSEIVIQLQIALERLPASSFTVERLDLILAAVRSLNSQAYSELSGVINKELADLVEYEITHQKQLFDNVLPVQVSTTTVNIEQVYAAALARPFQGKLLKEFMQALETDKAVRIRDAIRMGYIEGQTISQIVQRVRGTKALLYKDGIIEINKRNAEAVVRTAIGHTAAFTKDRFLEQNNEIIKALKWHSTLDGRTSEICFIGSTAVLPIGSLRNVFKRRYDGDIVTITTASGKQISSTPNHPILTARGWTRADEIKPSADVVYGVIGDVVDSKNCKNIKMITTFSALFDSVNNPAISDVFRVGSSKADFHGDGMGDGYKIERAAIKCDLGLKNKTSAKHQISKYFFRFVECRGVLFTNSDGNFLLNTDGLWNKSPKCQTVSFYNRIKTTFRNFCNLHNLRWLYSIIKHLNNFRFISAGFSSFSSLHNSFSFKKAGYSGGSGVIKSSDTGSGLSVAVSSDDVISVKREFFSGHVFNLSCDTELYIANGIIVHNCRARDGKLYTLKHVPIKHNLQWLGGPGNAHWNCRSSKTALVKSWQELGFDISEMPASDRASMDGGVPADTTYGQWLKGKPASFQDDVLGNAKGKLFRSGLDIERFSNNKGKSYTLNQLRERDASYFIKAGL